MPRLRKEYTNMLKEKFGYDESVADLDCIHVWDLNYKFEDGEDIEEELRRCIFLLNIGNIEEIYKLTIEYFEREKILRRYFMRGNRDGYGFEVIERVDKKYVLKFQSYKKNKCEKALLKLREDENAKLPDTSKEVPPTRILVIEDRDGRFYYEANTFEQFKKKAVDHIIACAKNNYYYKPETDYFDIKKRLGLSLEDINKLPDGEIKVHALKEVEMLKEHVERCKEHESAWECLKLVKKHKTKTPIGKIREVLTFFGREDSWNIVDAR